MIVSEFTKQRLRWFLENASRLGWLNETSLYYDICQKIEKSLNDDDFLEHKDAILMVTSGRVSECYAHLFKPYELNSEDPFTTWRTISEIHSAFSKEE